MTSLSFHQPYRSIQSLPAIDLPDFAIVTGINGSGKSHLLEAIRIGAVRVGGVPSGNSHIRLFSWGNLVPTPPQAITTKRKVPGPNMNAADPVQLGKDRRGVINSIASQFEKTRQTFLGQIKAFNLPFLPADDFKRACSITQEEFRQHQVQHQIRPDFWLNFQAYKKQADDSCLGAVGRYPVIQAALLKKVRAAGVMLASLTSDDIAEAVPIEWHTKDVFEQNFSETFAAYHRVWEENRYNDFLNKQYDDNRPVLTESQFRQRFGEPPWEFVNRILEEACLDYRVNNPTGSAEQPFEAKLLGKDDNSQISFGDLSSGEKILMSFAVCLYNSQDTRTHVAYPKMLLLDEVDAPLHPSMTKQLIRVLDQVLVREKGLKVILTTHSPATVALSPTGSLFRLDKHPRAIVPCTREQAIQALSSGYIAVTENARFVITEANQDRLVYTALSRKLVERGKLASPPNLVFVQASDKKDRNGGGREQVRNWSSKLPEAGLKQIYGLIDRDGTNVQGGTIFVVSRYSLENFLLDPVLVYAVLIDRGVHTKILDVGVKDKNFYDLREVEQTMLQKIADAVCEVVEKHAPDVKRISGKFDVEYLCGKTISAPAWLRDYQGHELVAAYRNAFKATVDSGFVLTANDCRELTEMLCERLPEFIPVELLKTFQQLQTA